MHACIRIYGCNASSLSVSRVDPIQIFHSNDSSFDSNLDASRRERKEKESFHPFQDFDPGLSGSGSTRNGRSPLALLRPLGCHVASMSSNEINRVFSELRNPHESQAKPLSLQKRRLKKKYPRTWPQIPIACGVGIRDRWALGTKPSKV